MLKNAEKEFFKLLNNSNFDYDCRNNLINCGFKHIFDEIDKLSDIKKYNSILDRSLSWFVNSRLLEEEIEKRLHWGVVKY